MELEKYYKDSYNTWVKRIKSRGVSHEDAEDIVQEAFTTALTYIHTFNPDLSNLSTWFTRIVDQTFSKMRRDALASVEITEFDIYSREADEYEGDKEQSKQVIKLIAGEKNRSHKQILFLYFVKGFKARDVAEHLNETTNNVEMVVKRFKTKVRDKYEKV